MSAPPCEHRSFSSPAEGPPLRPETRPATLFTCTFCWHLSSGPPHVLGRRSAARLACASCCRALFALAVCWACGEVVTRGDDAVSLGWCFWHRACYACLLCGSRPVARGVPVEDLFDYGPGEEGEGGAASGAGSGWDYYREQATSPARGEGARGPAVKLGVGRAREITEVPLCAHCLVEMEGDRLDERAVAQKALRRTDLPDGGLSRERWEAKEQEREQVPAPRENDNEPFPSRGHLTSFMEPSYIGMPSLPNSCPVPLESTIYVSMNDPIGEPSFKPSSTKPIPKWMQLLYGHSGEEEEYGRERPVSLLDQHFARPRGPAQEHGCKSSTNQSFPLRSRPGPTADRARGFQQVVSPVEDGLLEATYCPSAEGVGYRATSFVSAEPLRRPSSHPKQPRVHFTNAGSPLNRDRELFDGSLGFSSSYGLQPTTDPVAGNGSGYTPRQSSEYLDRYQPTIAGNGFGNTPRQPSEYLDLLQPTTGAATVAPFVQRVRQDSQAAPSAASVRGEAVTAATTSMSSAHGAAMERSPNWEESGPGGVDTNPGMEASVQGEAPGPARRVSLQDDLKRFFGW